MPKKKPAFDITSLRQAPRYSWRELQREGRDPLRIKVPYLSIGQIEAIPFSKDTQFHDVFAAIAEYVTEWNLTAEDIGTGQTIDVPPPAEVGPDVLSLLHHDEAMWVVTQVRHGHLLRVADEKKASMPSDTTPESQNGRDSAVVP